MSEKTNRHSLERTSPIGQRFVGKCVLCGKEGLTTADMLEGVCPNPKGTTAADALLDALEGPSHG